MALLASSCALGPGERRVRADYWPAYEGEYIDETGTTREDVLPPFFTYRHERESDAEEVTVRPFYSFLRDPAKERAEHLGLYPFGYYQHDWRPYGKPDDRTRKRKGWLMFPLFPITNGAGIGTLAGYTYHSPRPGEWEYDYFGLFPLIAGGDSSKEGEHFSFLPFAGNLKGLFGYDEINYVLGPLYIETRRGDNRNWWFPFPLLRYGSGPHYSSFGLYPFYAFAKQDGKYDRNTVLWPLVRWGVDDLDTAHPQHYWTALPFAARRWTDQTEMISALWPLINYVRAESTDTTIVDAPWPIFRWADGERYEEFRIWPLYMQSRRDKDWTYGALWPLFWHFDEVTDTYTQSRTWVLPLLWTRDREYLPDNDGIVRTERTMNLWPLFNYGRAVDNEWRWQFPSVLPFPNPLPYEETRFERLYGELFRVIALEGGDDHFGAKLLWGAASYYEDESESSWALNPLWRSHLTKHREPGVPRLGPHPADIEETDFLFGLTGYRKGPEGMSMKLLWFFELAY